MFTGIVEELGEVHEVVRQQDAVRLTLRAQTVLDDVHLGDSIAVNGCCLTVAATGSTASSSTADPATDGQQAAVDLWVADVMQESLDRTNLGSLQPGDRVNLERAVTADKRLGGHIVQGHVDAVGRVVSRSPSEHWELVELSMPSELAPYLVEKGSITVDGVSLTLVDVGQASFTVSLIPETLARTTLGFRRPGDPVNLEVDVIAKHVAKLVQAYLPGGTPSFPPGSDDENGRGADA